MTTPASRGSRKPRAVGRRAPSARRKRKMRNRLAACGFRLAARLIGVSYAIVINRDAPMHTCSPRPRRLMFMAGLLAASTGLACARNPATGARQLSLISESREIQMGREYDQEVRSSLGLYPDSALQRYVQELGARLAARSERPNLPWTFHVVDDPVVNAFALPGGFIFVTRGILGHLRSEAQLAAVVGHEIGHVTARHTVSQITKSQLATLGLVAGMIVRPELARFGDLAQAGMQLM